MEDVSDDALICLRLKHRKINVFHEDLFKLMVDAARQTCRHEYMPTEKRADRRIILRRPDRQCLNPITLKLITAVTTHCYTTHSRRRNHISNATVVGNKEQSRKIFAANFQVNSLKKSRIKQTTFTVTTLLLSN
jgi:transposase